ncbi:MAG: 4'-phosphopantetheinyl transferase superfamily protein [Burkholderiales bacterium]|jgi:4'-phosphopantetheinyl transferase|nr:4'-phosphopantetheinyl transferase superfamily protein [Burkholderiales bacterium]
MNHTAFPPFPETGLPPQRLPFEIAGVALWKVSLTQPDEAAAILLSWLDEREKKRTRQSMIARALLRWFLARELNCAPQALAFTTGEHGRPVLATGNGRVRDFNMSHSGGEALIGIVLAGSDFARIGVDLEQDKKPRDVLALARRVLTDDERATLNAANAEQRFLRYWTLKEAFSKADGRGFALGFQRLAFDVAEPPEEYAPQAIRLAAPETPTRWRFGFVPFGEGAVAAMALQKK